MYRKDQVVAFGVACAAMALALLAITIGIMQWRQQRNHGSQKRCSLTLEESMTNSQSKEPFICVH